VLIDPIKLYTQDVSHVEWEDATRIIRGGGGMSSALSLSMTRRGFRPVHPSVSFRLSLTLPRTEG
jgi:hypothetical protein